MLIYENVVMDANCTIYYSYQYKIGCCTVALANRVYMYIWLIGI